MPTLGQLLKNSTPDREYFLRYLLHMDLGQLYLHTDHIVEPTILKILEKLEKKRAAGWPMQYIIGEAWFFGRKFKVTPAVLVPRPETELLVERALAALKHGSQATAIDVGTGSGAIAISLAKNSGAKIIAADISTKALAIARANAKRHNAKIKFLLSNLLSNVTWPRTPFVLIAANLPYLSSARMAKLTKDVKREPKLALFGGADGLQLYKKLFKQISAARAKNQTVKILCEIDPEQKTKLAALARHEFAKIQIEYHRDLHGDTRLGEITLSSQQP